MANIVSVKIRPYARLLTMLGDQLIKNEIIAITELVKNSYDADAEHVKVSFLNFDNDIKITPDSQIIIEDDGNGMNKEILTSAWMNPATPEKLKRKKIQRKTDKGRIMQGEKGIGRFAIFKLGKHIQIITRRQKQIDNHYIDEPETENEYLLTYDFTKYDSDFLRRNNTDAEIFLDDIDVQLETRTAETIIAGDTTYGKTKEQRKPYGTKIIISQLTGIWSKDKAETLYQSLLRMQPIFQRQFTNDFSTFFSINNELFVSQKQSPEQLLDLLDNKSVFIVDGHYNEINKEICFEIDDHEKPTKYRFSLFDSEMIGIKPMQKYLDSIKSRDTECGSFYYKFYIMDLNVSIKDKNTKYYLDQDEEESIKNHRVYLYRDNIRVLPYGDADDDWLELDIIRGTEKASRILGNDQVTGYVLITQKDNPNLRDKTNREGLIEEGHAKEDLKSICQLVLRYVRAKPYAQYLVDKRRKKEEGKQLPESVIRESAQSQAGKEFVQMFLQKYGNIPVKNIDAEVFATQFFKDFEAAYTFDRSALERQIIVTEDLAAIGLSAETAYHDSRILLQQIKNRIKSLIDAYKNDSGEVVLKEVIVMDLSTLYKQISKVVELMHNLQKLFPSYRSKKTDVNVRPLIEKVKYLYSPSMDKAGIKCIINEKYPEPLIVNCTDAVILQVFINLFDNSLYWLNTVGKDRYINITINSKKGQILFSDSGPGVRKDDAPYIFEAFYSGKGENGKGLGLYIAQQLLGRYNAAIRLVSDTKNNAVLCGATFEISFMMEVNSDDGD